MVVVAVPDNESPDGLCNTCVKEIYKQTPTVLAMDSNGAHVSSKMDDERARHERRVRLKELNLSPRQQGRSLLLPSGNFSTLPTEFSRLDSSLKRHTTLIKRIRQSMTADNRDQILKDLESLSLEKYIDEIAGAVTEGIARCKTDKDTWGAVEV